MGRWPFVISSPLLATAAGTVSAHFRVCPSVPEPSWRRFATRSACWTDSMREVAAALCAGLGVTAAIVAIGLPPPAALDDSAPPTALRRYLDRYWAEEIAIAASAGWNVHGVQRLVAVQAVAAVAGGFSAALLTGLPVLAVARAALAVALVRAGFSARLRDRQVARQDAVLDSVRMLRQLLETGATSVQAAIAMLGERGPAPLRAEFRIIAGTTVRRRQAWSPARRRIRHP